MRFEPTIPEFKRVKTANGTVIGQLIYTNHIWSADWLFDYLKRFGLDMFPCLSLWGDGRVWRDGWSCLVQHIQLVFLLLQGQAIAAVFVSVAAVRPPAICDESANSCLFFQYRFIDERIRGDSKRDMVSRLLRHIMRPCRSDMSWSHFWQFPWPASCVGSQSSDVQAQTLRLSRIKHQQNEMT